MNDVPTAESSDRQPVSQPARQPSIWISADQTDVIAQVMIDAGWIAADETIATVQRAGDGNMNLTLRVITDRRSLIIKQARPWVEKYPSIEAPVERATYERRFYLAVQSDDFLRQKMPTVIGVVADHYLLALEDLGPSKDCSTIYAAGNGIDQEIDRVVSELVPWLVRLHGLQLTGLQQSEFRNTDLKKLNHDYMYVLPFSQSQGIDLDQVMPGLEAMAVALRSNEKLKMAAKELGLRYLATGDCLIHGDFFPGSWLTTGHGIKVIDPEFCHCGDAEFDVAVMIAHLRMTDTNVDPTEKVKQAYLQSAAGTVSIDWELVQRFAAVEVIRRILGLAQLPLAIGLDRRRQLIDAAVTALI